ncbi:BQ2448_6307 [Microbotryum intermedium]|uniref:BQ2448_6307 protein n=1 Tax=Microbotryum intermedium TaxID=269621 RepID=A0A238FKU7_9BASI|nr:BQ2448_6307 [Microbotryum intermedium]
MSDEEDTPPPPKSSAPNHATATTARPGRTARRSIPRPPPDSTSPLLGPRSSVHGQSSVKVHRQGEASMLGCIANLANTIIGTGALAMSVHSHFPRSGQKEEQDSDRYTRQTLIPTLFPSHSPPRPHAFASGGMIPGVLSVIWCGLCAALGLYFLSRSAAQAPHRAASFAALSRLTFPKLGRVFDLAIFLKCFGVSISYLSVRALPCITRGFNAGNSSDLGPFSARLVHRIVIGGLMPRVIYSFWSSSPDWLLDRRLWILFAMSMLCPLAFLRKLDSLKFTSYIALCAVANLVFVVVYMSFHRHDLPPRGTIEAIHLGPKFVQSLPVQIFAFTCAQNLFAVFNELKTNSQHRLNLVIGTSLGSAAVIYEILGILGYLCFGNLVGSNIIEMYPHSLLVSICQLGLVILVLFSYPLQLHPARASLDKVLYPPTDENVSGAGGAGQVDDHASSEIPLGRFVLESSGILLTTFCISMFVSSLEVVLGFVGATGSTTISFILPAIFFLSLFNNPMTPQDRLLRLAAWCLLVWGVLVMVVCLTLNAYHLTQTPKENGAGHDGLAILGTLGSIAAA